MEKQDTIKSKSLDILISLNASLGLRYSLDLEQPTMHLGSAVSKDPNTLFNCMFWSIEGSTMLGTAMVVGFCPYMRSARGFTKDMRARMEQGIFEKRKEEGRLAMKGKEIMYLQIIRTNG